MLDMETPTVASPDDVIIDLQGYRVLRRGVPVMLTYREYALLAYLALRAGHVVSRRRLLEEGMGRHDVGGLRMVDELVRRLKTKLEPGSRCLIEEQDSGYRFVTGSAVVS